MLSRVLLAVPRLYHLEFFPKTTDKILHFFAPQKILDVDIPCAVPIH